MGKTNCCQKVLSIVSLTLTPDKRIYLTFKDKLHAAWLITGHYGSKAKFEEGPFLADSVEKVISG
jgi:hypothetical protein